MQKTRISSASHDRRRAAETATAVPRLKSESILGGHAFVVIVHNGREYRLQETKNGKLILTA